MPRRRLASHRRVHLPGDLLTPRARATTIYRAQTQASRSAKHAGTRQASGSQVQDSLSESLLLLTVEARNRLKAVAEKHGESFVLRCEAPLSETPPSPELVHALSALSVACRLCGKEVSHLTDKKIAEGYLAVRGWSPARGAVKKSG